MVLESVGLCEERLQGVIAGGVNGVLTMFSGDGIMLLWCFREK